MAHLDRKKHDFDVMERVLGAVRDDSAPHTDVVELDIHSWAAGTTASVVQVTVLGRGGDKQAGRGPSDDDKKP